MDGNQDGAASHYETEQRAIMASMQSTGSREADGISARSMSPADYEKYQQMQRDEEMARSMMMANLIDAQAIEQALREVEAEFDPAQDDEERATLRRLQAQSETIDTNTLAKLAGAYIAPTAGRMLLTQSQGFESAMTETERLQRVNCTVCGDAKMYFDIIRTICGHIYCRGCVRTLFETAIKDESLFPPRCCREPITIDSVKIFLNPTIERTFAEKQVEYNTPNRTYCHNKNCSAFIIPVPEYEAQHYGRCERCHEFTCTDCKQQYHRPAGCTDDQETEAVLELAQTEGWRRCNQCRTMIELGMGCYHMTCTCGNEFCYLCGAHPWKTCQCPQWDEHRLTAQANRVAVRQGLRPAQQAQVREQIVQRHNCTHERWRGCEGGECDECGHNLPNFLYRCQRCHVEMCRRCRYNRVR